MVSGGLNDSNALSDQSEILVFNINKTIKILKGIAHVFEKSGYF